MSDPVKVEGVEHARYEIPDVEALQALNAGTADKRQQKRALTWIIENACATHAWAFKDDERATLVNLGRQLAGQEIIGLTRLKISDLRREEQ